jgi:hypothetical protein
MKKNLRYLAGAAVGAVVALGFSSCAYDPYYSSGGGVSYSSGGYGGGYGDGYGYGGSAFSTSLFVSTGDPRWGYDPYSYSYYDYNRHCYYDPYLNGYYPVGYRPRAVYGAPHPYGWRPGSGHIRPPGHITNVTVVNYRNREERYRNSSYGWAKQVRPGSGGGGRVEGQRPPQNNSGRGGYQNSGRTSYQNSDSRTNAGRLPYGQRENPKPGFQHGNSRQDSRYNNPVNSQPSYSRQGQGSSRPQQYSRQGQSAQRGPQPQQPQQRANSGNKKGKNDDDNRVRGYR